MKVSIDRMLAVAVALLALLIFLVLQSRYIWAQFLVTDDSFLVTGFMFDPPSVFFVDGLHYRLFSLLGTLHQVSALRLPFVIFHAILGGCFFLIFSAAGYGRILAVLSSFAVTFTAVFASQHIFVTGSHPIFGLAICAGGVVLLLSGDRRRGPIQWLWYGAAAIAFALAPLASDVFILAPLAFPLWFVGALIIQRDARAISALSVAAPIGILAVVIRYIRAVDHPYLTLVGWYDFTLNNITANLQKVMLHILKAEFTLPLVGWAMAIVAAGIVALGSFLLQRKARASKSAPARHADGRVAFILIVLSAITFAPAAIITFFTERYTIAPWTFGSAAFLAILPLFDWGRRSALACSILAGLLVSVIGIKIVSLQQRQDAELDRYFEFHKTIDDLVQRESLVWPSDAQIAIILNDGAFNPTNAYPHYSTGYLRHVADRYDILALIGSAEMADGWPFVPVVDPIWAKTEGYWDVKKGRSRRLKLVGLAVDRPLYAYRQDRNGQLQAIRQVAFVGKEGIKVVSRGNKPQAATSNVWSGTVCNAVGAQSMVWPGAEHSNLSKKTDPSRVLNQMADGSESVSVKIGAGTLVDVTMAIKAKPASVSENAPGTTILAPGVELSADKPGKMKLTLAGGTESYLLQSAGAQLRIQGREGCGYIVSVNGRPLAFTGARSLSGVWKRSEGFPWSIHTTVSVLR